MTTPSSMAYFELTPAEREAVHGWLREHGLDPSITPAEAAWDFDRASGEWRIPQYSLRNGHPYVSLSGEVAMVTVRRVPKRPPPWCPS